MYTASTAATTNNTTADANTSTTTASSSRKREVGHYVVTAHRPASVLLAQRCSFLAPKSTDVVIAKACRLEVRQLATNKQQSSDNMNTDTTTVEDESTFSTILDLPIRGRICTLLSFRPPGAITDYIFFSTERHYYGVLSYNGGVVVTHDTGTLSDSCIGRESECGPMAIVSPDNTVIGIHVYDGHVRFFPIVNAHGKSGGDGGGGGKHYHKGGLGGGGRGIRVLGESWMGRLDQQIVLGMTFLYGNSEHEEKLALLYQDSRGVQHVITHTIDLKNKEIIPYISNASASAGQSGSGIKKSRVDGGSGIMIAIPPPILPNRHNSNNDDNMDSKPSSTGDTSPASSPPLGGLILVGQTQITYLNNHGSNSKILPMEPTLMLAHTRIPLDDNSSSSGGGGNESFSDDKQQSHSRILLGDERGILHVLTLTRDSSSSIMTSLILDTLGITSIPSTLSYLDDGKVFVGSQFGDSQYIQLLSEPNFEGEGGAQYVEVLEEHINLGPIVDFDLVDLDKRGQSQVVTCSGSGKDGSIRVIRNGIGIQDQADVEIPGIKGMYNLRPSQSSIYDKFLLQSFIHETRILSILEDEMEETHIPGFQSNSATLYAGNTIPNHFVQVTEHMVLLVDCESFEEVDRWIPPNAIGGSITVANGNEMGQIVVALRGGVLVSLLVSQEEEGLLKMKCLSWKKLDQEVSCINLNSTHDDPNAMDVDENEPTISKVVAVGLWNDFSVRILSLCNTTTTTNNHGENALSELLRVDLGGDTQARSLLITTLEDSQRMLFVGLGDGQLISYFLNCTFHQNNTISTVTSHNRKKVSLGTQSISLSTFRNASNGNTCVFCTGDRPTVVYMSNSKLLYSNINLTTTPSSATSADGTTSSNQNEVVNWVTPFHCELFPDCLCLASEEELRIGIMDDIQKLHVQTFKLNEAPRRICHHLEGRMFAVGCVSCDGNSGGGVGGGGDVNMGNNVRFLDDVTFEEISRVDLDPFEMILSFQSCHLSPQSSTTNNQTTTSKPYIIVGTAYAYPDEDEPTKGRILLFESTNPDPSSSDNNNNNNNILARSVRQTCQTFTRGGVYSLTPFLNGSLLATINSKTLLFHWSADDGLKMDLTASHHGHILSLHSKAMGNVAIVGDLMRSVSVLQYYPASEELIEVARDFNSNWTTAVEMLTPTVYLGAENWNNLFCLGRNTESESEEVRCRLETRGEYHLGEMVNKFARGSLVMPSGGQSGEQQQPAAAAAVSSNAGDGGMVSIGSQTLYATVDGSIGLVLGLDKLNLSFFRSLERALSSEIAGVGGLSHEEFRAFVAERRVHPSRGFVDGDLVESFLDLKKYEMEAVVKRMNAEGGWDVVEDGGETVVVSSDQDEKCKVLTVEEVLTRVEEMSRLH